MVCIRNDIHPRMKSHNLYETLKFLEDAIDKINNLRVIEDKTKGGAPCPTDESAK